MYSFIDSSFNDLLSSLDNLKSNILIKTKEYDNKIFHLYNHNLVTLKYVVDVIKKAGFDIKVLSEENFKETIVKYSKEKNENLAIFLEYLKEFSTSVDKKDKIDDIIKELDYVEFDLNNRTFEDFDFIPNGVKDDVSIEKYPLFAEDFDDLVIITPFLSKSVIKLSNISK